MQVVLKCNLTYITLPVLDKKYADPTMARQVSKGNIWGTKKGKSRKKNQKRKPTKKDGGKTKVKYVQWPILNPAMLFRQMVHAGAMDLLQSDQFSWSKFWKAASKEDWCHRHPIHELSEEDRSKCIACTFHGDEGQGKRRKNTLVLSWSSIGVHGPSLYTKFPFCVSWLRFYQSFVLRDEPAI